MLGQFDPMSPAAHIWGPVMVLPYSGAADSMAALDTVDDDLGTSQVRVVVVDVTGARIEALEAAGLAQLLDHIEGAGAEAIVAGLSAEATPRFGLASPLLARDLSEGIALGFQMCLARLAAS